MNSQNHLIGDLRDLLGKYLGKEQLHQLKVILADVLALSPDSDSLDSLLRKYFAFLSFSEKKRLFIDTLITFVSNNLESSAYLEFSLEFSKINMLHGENNIAFEIAEQVLRLTENIKELEVAKGKALLLIAEFYMRQAIWKDAARNIREAKDIFERFGDKEGLARCEFLIGTQYAEQGDLEAASARLHNSLSYLKNKDNPLLSAMIDVNFGNISNMQGDLRGALEYYNKAIPVFDKLGDGRRKGETLQNIGLVYKSLKDFPAALAVFDECIEIAFTAGYMPEVNMGYLHKAEIYLEKDELESAYSFSQKTLELSYQLNDRLTIAEVHKLLGIIARKENKLSIAGIHLLTSLRLNQDLTQELNTAETNLELGNLHKQKGTFELARKYFNDALKYYVKVHNRSMVTKIEAELNSF